ncbi:MAG: prolipoprotein diacylglyceryl transferase [Isosphaeraceae bacterium]|nr:prolipoprotein diacylglyceryl transferase [Isosphaeraceae bacterium]
MRQILFTIPIFGGIKVFGYGTMLFLAFLASTRLAAWISRREKLNPEVIYDLTIWVFVGGLLGARLFYVIQYWDESIHSFWDIFRVWKGGIVLYGSIMGGTAAFFLYWFIRRFPLRPTLDAIAPALVLGIALGRVGCFLNGCCYGDLCENGWGVSFPPGSPPWFNQVTDEYNRPTDRLLPGVTPAMVVEARRGRILPGAPWARPVHPTQLYSAVDACVLMTLLLAYYPLRRRDGEVMALLMMIYPVTRFLIEYLRNDEAAFFASLTISQNISVLIFLSGLAYWFRLSRWPAERYADRQEDAPHPNQLQAV